MQLSNNHPAIQPRYLKARAGPNGLHLFNRLTGLNILLDEIRLPSEQWALAPRQVSIALTNVCDLRCSYCYAPKHAATVDAQRLILWLNELDQHGCLGVGFGGGEPTLYRDLVDICRYASTHTGLAITFTTHGHWLHDQLAADLQDHIHFIRVSMDGIGATYEHFRGRPFSSFQRCLETIRMLAPFGINFVVNRLTLPDLDAALVFAAEAGAREFLLLPERATSKTSGIDHDTRVALSAWIDAYQGPIPLSINEEDAIGMPTCRPFLREMGLSAYAHVDASGMVKRTSYDVIGTSVGELGLLNAIGELKALIGE